MSNNSVNTSEYDFEILLANSDEVTALNKMIEKFEEFEFLSEYGDCVLVVANHKRKTKEEDLEKGATRSVQITKLSPKIVDVLEQLSGKRYMFMLEIASQDFDNDTALDFNQLKAMMYFELRRITPEMKLGPSGPNDWMRILHGLGSDYNRLDGTCTDILSDDFSWEKILGGYKDYLTPEDGRQSQRRSLP